MEIEHFKMLIILGNIVAINDFMYLHWRRSALNSAGALQGGSGEFRGIFTPFYAVNFRGLCKSGGARAPAAPPSSAPMYTYVEIIFQKINFPAF